MAEGAPPDCPDSAGGPPGWASNPQIGAKGGAGGGGNGWWLDIFGRGPDTFSHRLRTRFPPFREILRGMGKRVAGMVPVGRVPRDQEGVARRWLRPAFRSVSVRFLPFPPVTLREFRLFRFPAFFRIGTVFRTGTSVPSGAWVEPRLPRRPPRTVCLRRRSVATSLASISAVGDPVRLRGSGGFPGNGHRSVRSPLRGSVCPDGRRWCCHRSIRGSC